MSFESKPTGLLKTKKRHKRHKKSTDTFPDGAIRCSASATATAAAAELSGEAASMKILLSGLGLTGE